MIRILNRTLSYLTLIIVSIIALYPLMIMLRISLIEPTKYFNVPVSWFSKITMEHYIDVFVNSGFPWLLLNSLIIAISATLIIMVTGSLAAFAIARYKLSKRVKNNILIVILSTRMGPPVVFALPIYIMFIDMKMLDTHIGLTLVQTFANLAFAIWIMYGFFKDIPPEIEEAAMIDGLGMLGVFLRVSLPAAFSGIIATATIAFILTWNEFFYALILTQSDASTFPIEIPSFFGVTSVDWGGMFAASMLGITVPLILGIAVRKHLARGFSMGVTD